LTSRHARSLLRPAAEFLLVVLGVVVGLGVDRWMQNLDERDVAIAALQRTLTDLELNARIFAGQRYDAHRSIESAEALQAMLRGDIPRASDALLVALIDRAGIYNTVPPADSSFRDLQSTGNLRLLRDETLRADIVRYFTYQIQGGRPFLETRADLRIRTFAHEWTPPDFSSRSVLCEENPSDVDCVRLRLPENYGKALWQALSTDAQMPRILNARLVDLVAFEAMFDRWLAATRTLKTRVASELEQTYDTRKKHANPLS